MPHLRAFRESDASRTCGIWSRSLQPANSASRRLFVCEPDFPCIRPAPSGVFSNVKRFATQEARRQMKRVWVAIMMIGLLGIAGTVSALHRYTPEHLQIT